MPIYLPDTNLFRYISSDDTESYKQTAQAFFSQVQKEIAEDKSTILLSEEVKIELEVQMHTLKDREQRIIQGVLEQTTVNANLSVQLEHDLRKFSNYIRSPRFNGVFKIPNYKMDYLRTSDARILVDLANNKDPRGQRRSPFSVSHNVVPERSNLKLVQKRFARPILKVPTKFTAFCAK